MVRPAFPAAVVIGIDTGDILEKCLFKCLQELLVVQTILSIGNASAEFLAPRKPVGILFKQSVLRKNPINGMTVAARRCRKTTAPCIGDAAVVDTAADTEAYIVADVRTGDGIAHFHLRFPREVKGRIDRKTGDCGNKFFQRVPEADADHVFQIMFDSIQNPAVGVFLSSGQNKRTVRRTDDPSFRTVQRIASAVCSDPVQRGKAGLAK